MSTMKQLAIALCVMAIWLGPASRAVYEVIELAVKSLP
jgi:hypothetical protein